jgi:hypothetical protein
MYLSSSLEHSTDYLLQSPDPAPSTALRLPSLPPLGPPPLRGTPPSSRQLFPLQCPEVVPSPAAFPPVRRAQHRTLRQLPPTRAPRRLRLLRLPPAPCSSTASAVVLAGLVVLAVSHRTLVLSSTVSILCLCGKSSGLTIVSAYYSQCL